MTAPMQNVQRKLQRLLDEHESTAGMYVRIHGQHLIVGREESAGPNETTNEMIEFGSLVLMREDTG